LKKRFYSIIDYPVVRETGLWWEVLGYAKPTRVNRNPLLLSSHVFTTLPRVLGNEITQTQSQQSSLPPFIISDWYCSCWFVLEPQAQKEEWVRWGVCY